MAITTLQTWTVVGTGLIITLALVGVQGWLAWREAMAGIPSVPLEMVRGFGPLNGMVLAGALRGTTVGLIVGALGFAIILGLAAGLRAGLVPGLATFAIGLISGGVIGAASGALFGMLWGAFIRFRNTEYVVLATIALAAAGVGAVVGAQISSEVWVVGVGALLLGGFGGLFAWRWQPALPSAND